MLLRLKQGLNPKLETVFDTDDFRAAVGFERDGRIQSQVFLVGMATAIVVDETPEVIERRVNDRLPVDPKGKLSRFLRRFADVLADIRSKYKANGERFIGEVMVDLQGRSDIEDMYEDERISDLF
jgi:hypothetical protein